MERECWRVLEIFFFFFGFERENCWRENFHCWGGAFHEEEEILVSRFPAAEKNFELGTFFFLLLLKILIYSLLIHEYGFAIRCGRQGPQVCFG